MNKENYFTFKEVATYLKVGLEPVLLWINKGQLTAVNVSNFRNRPRWRISRTDLQAFMDARKNQVTASVSNHS